MIKKQHAIVLAILATIITTAFFLYLNKPTDPKSEVGYYLAPTSTLSPNTNNNLNVLLEKGYFSSNITPKKIPTASLIANGNQFNYKFSKATKDNPDYNNFSLSIPQYWNIYEIGPTNNQGSYPVAGKYVVLLENTKTNEFISISQTAGLIFGCSFEDDNSLSCPRGNIKEINTNFGKSYLYDSRTQSIDSTHRLCIDIQDNQQNTLNYDNNKLNVDCTFGSSIGKIDVFSNTIDSSDKLSQDILEIINSIKAIN